MLIYRTHNKIFRVWIAHLFRLQLTIMRWQALTVINPRMAHRWTLSLVWTRPNADGTRLLHFQWVTRL